MKVINSTDTFPLPTITNALLFQINVNGEHDPTLPSGPVLPSFWDAETPAGAELGGVSTHMHGGRASSTSVPGDMGPVQRLSH